MKQSHSANHTIPLWLPWCGVIFSAVAFITALLLGLENQPSSVPCNGRYWQLCQLIFGSIEQLLGAWPAHVLYVLSFFCTGLFVGRLAWSGFSWRRAENNKSSST